MVFIVFGWIKFFKNINIVRVFVLFLFNEIWVVIKDDCILKNGLCCFLWNNGVYVWK